MSPLAGLLEQEYVHQMPTVWLRDDPGRRVRFHRSPECRQLRKAPAKGTHHPLLALDLDEVDYSPCLTCYPDAPRLRIRKVYCEICQSAKACQHNGGVLCTVRDGSQQWLWPDTHQMPYYRRSA